MTRKSSERRGFLKLSAAFVGGAAAVPYVWSSSYAKAEAKNDRPNIALIGCGGRGSGDARTASRYGDLVACCDVDAGQAARFAKWAENKAGAKIDTYEDYRKLLERKDIDAIIGGTPDHWHTAVYLAAVRSGKDVYGEKPLTLTIDEGKLICKALKKSDRVFQVGTQQRSDRRFQQAVAIARSGRLGKKLTATCYIGSGPKGGPFKEKQPPKDLNWDFWLGQAPLVPYVKERCHGTFRWWMDYSGGKLTDWGAHHIDIAQWGIGAENGGPVEIEGSGLFDERKNCYDSAQSFTCTLTFANGNKIIVKNGPGNGIHFEGEKEHIFVNRGSLKGNLVNKILADEKEEAKLNAQVAALYAGDRSGGHMANFFNCIKDRKEPISDVYSHHRAMTSCHLCNIAMKLKRKLKWDPVKEDFLGDSEASAMRARKQRKPYTIEG
jgi:myo-inositol 2-dehydrogenase/D-chiro-inositol 1-dehydrogenase